MAENTTTYTTVLDVKVTGDEQVKDLGDKTEETETKFVSLRSKIRETTVALQALEAQGDTTSDKFQKLRADLDELNDAQDRVNFQAGQFDDQLASLPGPLGAIGGGIKSFNEGLNRLSTGFKVAFGVVGLIVSAFFALKEALSRTEEGQAKLTKITESFEKILNGLFAVIEPIAFALADLAAQFLTNKTVLDVLGKTVGVVAGVFTGLLGTLTSVGKFIYDVLITNFKTLISVAKGAGDVIKGVFTFDWALIKKGAEDTFGAVKKGIESQVANTKNLVKGVTTAVVDGYNAAQKGFTEGSKRMTAAELEAYKKRQEELKKAKEAADAKAEAARLKAEEERKKNIEAAQKVQVENYIATLAARDAEIYKAGQKLQEDLLALEKAGFTDRSGALEAHRIATDGINKKYDDEAAKKAEEEKKKKDEEAKAADEEAKKLAEEKLAKENTAREDSAALLEGEFLLKKANNQATFQDELDLFDRTVQLGKETMAANGESNDAIAAYDKQTAAKRIEIEKAQQQAKLSIISNALGAVADLVGKETVAGKALSVAQAIINTYQGATLALASSPPPFNFIAAGTVVAAGLINVKKILETKLPGVPGGSSGAGAGGTPQLPQAPSLPTINAPQIAGTQPATPGAQIASTLAQASNKPMKAYVVSGDVSSQQALDRRTTAAATF